MKTFKARIAVSVSSSGRWGARGGTGYMESEALHNTRIEADDGGALAQCWVEVDIPIPEISVIAAKCGEVVP